MLPSSSATAMLAASTAFSRAPSSTRPEHGGGQTRSASTGCRFPAKARPHAGHRAQHDERALTLVGELVGDGRERRGRSREVRAHHPIDVLGRHAQPGVVAGQPDRAQHQVQPAEPFGRVGHETGVRTDVERVPGDGVRPTRERSRR